MGDAVTHRITLTETVSLRAMVFDSLSNELWSIDDGNPAQVRIYPFSLGSSAVSKTTRFALPDGPSGERPANVTGAAYRLEGGVPTLYVLTSGLSGVPGQTAMFSSRIFRVTVDRTGTTRVPTTTHVISLDAAVFGLANTRATALAEDGAGNLVIAYQRGDLPVLGSAYDWDDEDRAATRGLMAFRIDGTCTEPNYFAVKGVPWVGPCLGAAVLGLGAVKPRQLPDSLKSRYAYNSGLALFHRDGVNYLVAAISNSGSNDLYVADPLTGRGLFVFAPPTGGGGGDHPLAFTGSVLLVGQRLNQADDAVEVVSVLEDGRTALVGPRYARKIWAQQEIGHLSSAAPYADGFEIHSFGMIHPPSISPGQGHVFGTEAMVTEKRTGGSYVARSANVTHNYYAVGQHTQTWLGATYTGVTNETLRTTFTMDFWHGLHRQYVYPHLAVDDHTTAFSAGSPFQLGQVDDSQMFRFATNANTVYAPFIANVKSYLVAKYGISESQVDLSNPYWAARNVQEYLQDNFNYPMAGVAEGFTVGHVNAFEDHAVFDYASTPSYWKLSYATIDPARTNDRFCDGTAARDGLYKHVLMCASAASAFIGAMRYLGFPARWKGTSQRQGRDSCPSANWNETYGFIQAFCDLNLNGVFDGEDYMTASNGHMTTEVWLGALYGWQRFEVTPVQPGDTDGDGLAGMDGVTADPVTAPSTYQSQLTTACRDWGRLHARLPQWVFMAEYSAAGHQEKAVTTSMGVGYTEPFFADFSDNGSSACGQPGAARCDGDTVYNFGREYDEPNKREWGSRTIRFLPSLGFTVSSLKSLATGNWVVGAVPTGPWGTVNSGALVEIVARNVATGAETVLASGLAYTFGSRSVKVTAVPAGSYYFVVRQESGDKVVGGASTARTLP